MACANVEDKQNSFYLSIGSRQSVVEWLSLFFGENVYPDTALERRELPDCIYSVNNSEPLIHENYKIAYQVTYGISIRDENIANLEEKFIALSQFLNAKSGIEVKGWATGFEQEIETYVLAFELEIIIPFAEKKGGNYECLLMQSDIVAQNNNYDGCHHQKIESAKQIVIFADSFNQLQEQRQEINQKIIGKQLPANLLPLSYLAGQSLGEKSGLFVWVDVYQSVLRYP